MTLYADHPARRARQVAGDVVVLAWVVGCVLLGVAVHRAVAAVAEPLRRVAAVGGDIEDSMTSAGSTVVEVPVVGGRLGQPFVEVAAAGERLRTAGLDGAGLVENLAVVVGVLLALLPAAAILLPWVALRLRFARRAGEVRRLAAGPDGLDLLALRALVRQPSERLALVGASPVTAWRDGDPDVRSRLAALELDRWGLRPAGDAAAAGDGRAAPGARPT